MTTIEGNKLIAEFEKLRVDKNRVGLSFYHNNYLYGVGDLQYHSSWDWIMPVVEKISKIEFDRDEQELPFGGTEVIIHTHYPRTFGMLNNEGKPMVRFNAMGLHIAGFALALLAPGFVGNDKCKRG